MTPTASKDPPAGLEMSSLSSKSESPVKSQDYKAQDHSAITLNDSDDHHNYHKAVTNDSASDTATNSSDEFDWEAEEDDSNAKDLEGKRKFRRGRKLYGLFMRLARPIRTFLVAVLGAGIFITPLLVTQFRFRDSPARPHVHAWSLWLSITWAASSVTYLVVDLLPRFIIFVVTLFHGQVENLKTQIEVFAEWFEVPHAYLISL